MKKIKVYISNYNPKDPFSYGVFIMKLLQKYYIVEVDANKPEYVFFNESDSSHLSFINTVKIFYTGENIHPNFNLCDYAIGFDYLEFGDRYHRFPVYMISQFYNEEEVKSTQGKHFSEQINFTNEDLGRKTGFASFVYSNYLGESAREDFFNLLSAYKKVNAGGAYLNNIGGRVKNKIDFESKHKFSIAFENSSNDGYTTEKLPNAISARTIPIYWGNPKVNLEFNEKRFINCMRYKDFNSVIAEIKRIDSDDEAYLQMINQPVTSSYDFISAYTKLEEFIRHIIDQPHKEAKRIKINPAKYKLLIEHESKVAQLTTRNARIKKIFATIYKPFKNLPFLDRIKQLYFRKKILK